MSKTGGASSSSIEEMRAAGLQVQDLAAVLAGLRPMCRLGLRRGGRARRLLKRAALAGELAVHAYRDDYEGGGDEIVLLGREPGRLAAFEAAVAAKARAKDSAESRGATRLMGELLGYPACCARAFAATERGRGAARFAERLLKKEGVGPHPCAANFLFNFHSRTGSELERLLAGGYRGMDFYLVPWVPCSFFCPSTRRYGRALRAVLAQVAPAFAAGLDGALAAPVVFVDEWRFAPLAGAKARGGRLSYVGVADVGTLLAREDLALLERGDAAAAGRGGVTVLRGGEKIGVVKKARLVRFR